MNIPIELSSQLNKMYELVSEQVKHDYETKLKEMESKSPEQFASPSTEDNLEKQFSSLKLQSALDSKSFHKQLTTRETQIVDLQVRYDELNKIYHAEQSHRQLVEHEKALVLTELDKNDGALLKKEIQQRDTEIETLNLTGRVLNHHYRQLTEKFENLKDKSQQSDADLASVELKYQQQGTELERVKRQLTMLEEQNTQQMAKIKSQKNDLELAMGSYYNGVLNIEKKTSINVPQKNNYK
tara:strand:+ start:52883 stop:53602 length:720 start_codon:yes stop_codon:yes gene_type:complete